MEPFKMTDTQIKYDQVRALAEEVVAENPNLVNPRDVRGCLYKKRDDDDGENVAERCLGGEVLFRLGVRLPTERSPIHDTPDVEQFTKKALFFLRELQNSADYISNGVPRTWGEALSLLNGYFERDYGTFPDG